MANYEGLPGRNMDAIYEALANGLAARGYTLETLLKTDASAVYSEAADWLRCSLMPEDCKDTPLRYHDQANSLATAALCQIDFFPVNWQFQPNQANGANAQLGPTDMAVFSFDDNPLNILCVYDPNPNYSPWVYIWMYNGESTLRWNQSGQLQVNKAIVDLSDPTSWDPHGLYLYSQYDSALNNYLWIDCRPGSVDSTGAARPSKITIKFPSVTALPTVRLFDVGLYRYFGGSPKLCSLQEIINTNVNLTLVGGFMQLVFTLDNNTNDPLLALFPTYSDYYTLIIGRVATDDTNYPAANAAILGGVNVKHDGQMSVLKHIAVKVRFRTCSWKFIMLYGPREYLKGEAESLINVFSDKGRINAQAVRVTDIPMLQYQNGLIAGATAYSGNNWYQIWQHGLEGNNSFFIRVAKLPGALSHEIWKGGYIYHKPSDLKDFFWQKWISWDENTKEPNNVGVSLETDRPVKIIAMNATNDFTTGNPSGGGCVAALTYACMLEWVCPVSWYPVAKSPFSMEGCAKGIDAMGGFPDFVENDTHWEKMLGYAAAVADHGAPLFRALINSGADRLGKLSPFLGRVAKSAGNAAITAAQKYNRGQKRGTE